MALARCSMLFGSSWRSPRSHLLETRSEGIEAFSRASRQGSVWSSWWLAVSRLGLTQHDWNVLKRVLVGNVVQGACGVDCGYARVCGPGDFVVAVDDHVFELALQHADLESGVVEIDAAGTDGSLGLRDEAQGLLDEGRLAHSDGADDSNVDLVFSVVVGLQEAVGTGFGIEAQAVQSRRLRRCARQRALP